MDFNVRRTVHAGIGYIVIGDMLSPALNFACDHEQRLQLCRYVGILKIGLHLANEILCVIQMGRCYRTMNRLAEVTVAQIIDRADGRLVRMEWYGVGDTVGGCVRAEMPALRMAVHEGRQGPRRDCLQQFRTGPRVPHVMQEFVPHVGLQAHACAIWRKYSLGRFPLLPGYDDLGEHIFK